MERHRTFLRRVAASLLDGLLFIPLLPALYYLSLPERGVALLICSQISWYVIGYGYRIIFHARYGQTLGKRWVSIVVVSGSGEGHLTWRQAIIRECGNLAISALQLGYFVYLLLVQQYFLLADTRGMFAKVIGAASAIWLVLELIALIRDRRQQTVHDLIADTVVIRTKALQERDIKIGFPSPTVGEDRSLELPG